MESTKSNMMMNKMIINLNVFSALTKYIIASDLNSASIVLMKSNWRWVRKLIFSNKQRVQSNSAIASTRARYFDSVCSRNNDFDLIPQVYGLRQVIKWRIESEYRLTEID